jgi:hypothetical protein
MREVMPERYIRISQKDSRSQALYIRHGAFEGSVYLSDNHSIIASSLLLKPSPKIKHQSGAT